VRGRIHLVRRRGALDLRVDGALLSSIRPGGSTTHPVWEALAAPLLALPKERRRAILLLGLGGGAVARAARALAPRARIVAVDRDRDVVLAARRHFGVAELGIEIVVEDARAFLERERRRYDAILEDLFLGSSRSVRKPDWLPEPGVSLALARLRKGGLIASNTIHEGASMARALLAHAPAIVSIAVSGFFNHVLVAGAPARSARRLRRGLAADPRLRLTLPRLALRTLRAPARPVPTETPMA
jgi:spermidine synthase